MVTVRQFSSGVGRTLRAMDRAAQRQQRQRALYEKALAKQAMLDAAEEAVDAYDTLVEALTEAHRIDFSRMDWASTASAAVPADPAYSNAMEHRAAAALARYRPGWLARMLGLARRRRAKLARAVVKGRADDVADHEAACTAAAKRREEIAFARSVIARDSKALIEAARLHLKLDGVAIESVNILAVAGRVIVVADAYEVEDMPSQSATLLKSGKASFKDLTTGRIFEFHRDNICSSALRIAAEFLRVLPLDAVEVIMETDLLDRATGHIDPRPVLYVRVTAQALGMVNMKMADPAPLAERLGAYLDWNRKDGFRPIDLTMHRLPDELFAAAPAPADTSA